MNADHALFIGNTHSICQDYALSGVVDNGAYAIVCDGCSQSPEVDFGARALAFSAKRTLGLGTDMKCDLFGKITIDNLKNLGDIFPLNPRALDATLLITFIKGSMFRTHMFGDGVFFHQTATTLRVIHVEYEDNKPAYLSYYLDKVRMKDYEDTVFGSKHITDISLYKPTSSELPSDNSSDSEDYVKNFEPTTISGLVSTGDVIGVCSDGIHSFRRGDSSDIKWQEMVDEFIDFKSTNGVFVQRRLTFLKRQWAKNNITHYDDISMAAIVV